MHYLYKYLLYQNNTKIYDKDFIIPVTEQTIDELVYIFRNLPLVYIMFRGRQFECYIDQLQWCYAISEKVYGNEIDPYMYVAHRDLPGQMSLTTMPQYFKNTRQHKITPNLWDLDNLDLRNRLDKEDPYQRKPMYRNCFRTPIAPLDLNELQ